MHTRTYQTCSWNPASKSGTRVIAWLAPRSHLFQIYLVESRFIRCRLLVSEHGTEQFCGYCWQKCADIAQQQVAPDNGRGANVYPGGVQWLANSKAATDAQRSDCTDQGLAWQLQKAGPKTTDT